MREVTFIVRGEPKPKGSKTMGTRKDGSSFMREAAAGLDRWIGDVRDEARVHLTPWPRQVPVSVTYLFLFRHPKQQTGYKATAPDLDKLERAVNDALQQSGLLTNDAQIVHQSSTKRWGSESGVRVTIRDVS